MGISGFVPVDLVGKNARGGKGRGDSQAFVACRQEYGLVSSPRPDQRKLVGSGSAKSRPGTDGGHLRQARHVFLRALQHADEHGVIDLLLLCTVLAR